MITVHRRYRVAGKPQLHAHVGVNPLGKLSVDVLETHQHHVAEFEQVKFENSKAMFESSVLIKTALADRTRSARCSAFGTCDARCYQ